MNHIKLPKKFNILSFILIIGIIIIFSIVLLLFGCDTNNITNKNLPPIFELKNTQEVIKPNGSNSVTFRKHFMILNPPSDLNNLKKSIEKFNNNVKFNNAKPADKKVFYSSYFYRRSNKFNENWQTSAGGFNSNTIDDHKGDLIASIDWSEDNGDKIYTCMEKSQDKENYGIVQNELHFLNDKAVDSRELRNIMQNFR